MSGFAAFTPVPGAWHYQNDRVALLSDFGAVGGQKVDTALTAAFSELPSGAVLYVDPSKNGLPYLIDLAHERTAPLTMVGLPGHQFKQADQSTIFHDGTATKRDLIGFSASDSACIGVNLDLNSPNNYTESGGVKTFHSSTLFVNGIVFRGSASGGPHERLQAVGNRVHRATGQAIAMLGGMGASDGAYAYDAANGIDGFLIADNLVSEGQNSIINMSGGVRNGVVRGNRGVDCWYDFIRAYRQALNVDITGNTLMVREGGLDHALWVDDDAGNTTFRQGIRIGHNSSATGTCHDIRITRNTLRVMDDTIGTGMDQALVRVSAGCTNVRVEGNDLTPGAMLYGVNIEQPGAGIVVRGNTVHCADVTEVGVRYFGSTDGAVIEANDVRRPKVHAYRLSTCENVRLLRNLATRGTADVFALNFTETAVNNVVDGTELIGFASDKLASSAAQSANTFR